VSSTDLTASSSQLGLTTRQARKLQREEATTALEVHGHRRDARKLAASAEALIEALADVNRTAMNEEMDLVDSGIVRAGGSQLKSASVARALQRQVTLGDRIVYRTFRGW
jgi:hypothetical protein